MNEIAGFRMHELNLWRSYWTLNRQVLRDRGLARGGVWIEPYTVTKIKRGRDFRSEPEKRKYRYHRWCIPCGDRIRHEHIKIDHVVAAREEVRRRNEYNRLGGMLKKVSQEFRIGDRVRVIHPETRVERCRGVVAEILEDPVTVIQESYHYSVEGKVYRVPGSGDWRHQDWQVPESLELLSPLRKGEHTQLPFL